MINRRQTLANGSCALLAMLVGTAAARSAAREETSLIRQSAIAPREARKPLDFELFYDLSRYITARSQLDRRVAQLHFEYFRREEWGGVTAARLYAVIQSELDTGLASVPELLAARKLPELEHWYAQHVLDAWYEGFYRYDGAEVRVTFADALMWKAVEGIVPVQGMSEAEYGFWAEPPAPEYLK
jgi:hypothetical protein